MDGFTITIIGCLLLIILGMGATFVVAFRKVETILNETEKQIARAEKTFNDSTDFLADKIGQTIEKMDESNKRTNAWVRRITEDMKQTKEDLKKAEANTADCMRIHALRKDYE